MFNSYLYKRAIANKIFSIFMFAILALVTVTLSACDSEPPKLMKAVKQFDTDARRDAHIANMRKNHKDLLRHKRDETVIKGIRTKKNSLKACINCHVPAEFEGKVLRHTDPRHFCATCHNYVAAKPDCFQCHLDHPVSDSVSVGSFDNDQDGASHKTSLIPKSLKKPAQKIVFNTTTNLTETNSSNVVTGESRSE